MGSLLRIIRTGAVAATCTALLAAPPVLAQAEACPASGPRVILVDIDEPSSGDLVSGTVTVEGSAGSPARFDRLELLVDGTLVTGETFDLTYSETFGFAWDTTTVAPGVTEVEVVACNTSTGTRGIQSVTTHVADPLTPPPPSASSAEPVGDAPTEEPAATSEAPTDPPPTAEARLTAAHIPETTAQAPAPPPPAPATDGTPQPLAVDVAPPFGNLTLAEDPAAPGPPLWVGGIVGGAGLLGLTYAFFGPVRSRRRAAEATSELPRL